MCAHLCACRFLLLATLMKTSLGEERKGLEEGKEGNREVVKQWVKRIFERVKEKS